MRISCGTDIVENSRILDLVKRFPRFLEKNYTIREIEYCKSKKALMAQCIAVRFAAKEAVAKALGTGFSGVIQPIQIEIANDEKGKPYVILGEKVKESFPDIKDISISLSHCNEYSVAYALITFGED